MERKIVDEQTVPFKDLPFKALADSDRQLAHPLSQKAKTLALQLVGDRFDIDFPNGIYIMGNKFADHTGYRGAEVLVEKFHAIPDDPDCNERDFSIAFFPNKTINRPNGHGVNKITFEDGEEIYEEDGVNEMYEVPAGELEQLLKDLQDCQEPNFPQTSWGGLLDHIRIGSSSSSDDIK